MRVAIYARVSTNDQKCEMQLGALRQYVAAREWSEAEEFVDQGISGAKKERPALANIMKAARERRIDVIAVWKLDRFGRSLINLVELIAELSSLGVRFIAITEGIDTDKNNPTATFFLNIMCCFAQFEREIIRERIQAGVARAIEERKKDGGRWGRRAPVYDRTRMAELVAQGATIAEIQEALGLSFGVAQRARAALRAK